MVCKLFPIHKLDFIGTYQQHSRKTTGIGSLSEEGKFSPQESLRDRIVSGCLYKEISVSRRI